MSPPMFSNKDQLALWLVSKGVNLSQWGSEGRKTIDHLWIEITSGEADIQNDPPLRVIKVVQIIIRNGTKILVEARQVRDEGAYRYRGFPPSEKIKRDEMPVEAALRGIEEELGIDRSQVISLHLLPEVTEEMRESRSYPGLYTKYIITQVEAIIDNLPIEDFLTAESRNIGHQQVTKHYWSWREDRNSQT